jgi:hypothetical protein
VILVSRFGESLVAIEGRELTVEEAGDWRTTAGSHVEERTDGQHR